MALHSNETGSSIHVSHAFTYADQSARTGASGLVSADIGKIAKQTDNDTYYVLTNHSPITWVQITHPITTKGDLMSYDGSKLVRLAVGTNGQLLSANSAQSSGLEWTSSGVSASTDEVTVDTGNGHGSTGTCIRRFVNIRKNVGTSITYADSATNGGSFTINTSGIYAISYCDRDAGASGRIFGISVNAASLTTTISSTTYANGKRAVEANEGAGSPGCCSWTGYLTASDVVRAHTSGTIAGADDNTTFTIKRIL